MLPTLLGNLTTRRPSTGNSFLEGDSEICRSDRHLATVDYAGLPTSVSWSSSRHHSTVSIGSRSSSRRPSTVSVSDAQQMQEKTTETCPEVRFADAFASLSTSVLKPVKCAGRLRPMIEIGTIIQRLTDSSYTVRSSASKALTSVIANGRVREVGAVIEYLKHADPRVRSSVLRCLSTPHCARFPMECEANVINSIIFLLRDEDADVRAAAVCALGGKASKGDRSVMQAISACLNDGCSHVRASAVHALGRLAKRGDTARVNTIFTCLYDEDAEVRVAGLQALGDVAVKGDQRLVDLILEQLKDLDLEVREAAMRTLNKVATLDDARVQQAIQEHLDDAAPHVRFSAKYLTLCLAWSELNT